VVHIRFNQLLIRRKHKKRHLAFKHSFNAAEFHDVEQFSQHEKEINNGG